MFSLKRYMRHSVLAIITAALLVAPLQSESTAYYRVRPGDTLSKIAARHRMNVRQLAQLNNMRLSDTLVAGRQIRVAGSSASQGSARTAPVYHRVRSGETLSHLAVRYRTTVSRLRSWNGMRAGQVLPAGRTIKVGFRTVQPPVRVGHEWQQVTPYTRVLVPYTYALPEPQKREFEGPSFKVKMYAERFAQGNATYFEILPAGGNEGARSILEAQSIQVKFYDQTVPVDRKPWGYSGLIALSPEKRPGSYNLEIHLKMPGEEGAATEHYAFPVQIAETSYRTYTRRVYLGHAENWQPMAEEIQELIRESSRKKAQVFGTRSSNKFTGSLAHPRDLHKVTSPFFVRRRAIRWYYKEGRKVEEQPRVRMHRGLDLRGRTGDPIFAMADGTVLCAQRMHFEGNYTVIDHGNGIFTGYMHQSRLLVREGHRVRAGQMIGHSGATGAARGAHLHVGLWIRGIPVHPLSLIALPIRE